MKFLKRLFDIVLPSRNIESGVLESQVTVKSTPDEQPVASGPRKVSLHTGINAYHYPIPPLRGCVKDALSFRDIMKQKGFETTLMTDADCTKPNIVAALARLTSTLKAGDLFVWTNSSHGSQVKDPTGEEPDGQDEVIVTVDGGFIRDNDIGKLVDDLNARGVRVQVLSDSCHSGTLTRELILELEPATEQKKDKIRWIHPDLIGKKAAEPTKEGTPIFKSVLAEKNEMAEILASGCRSDQVSYDARINGVSMGAFSYYVVEAIKANPNITWADLAKEVAKNLPSSQYGQNPQFAGDPEKLAQPVFS